MLFLLVPTLIPWAGAQQGCRLQLICQQDAARPPPTPTPSRKAKTTLGPFVLATLRTEGGNKPKFHGRVEGGWVPCPRQCDS